MVAPEAVLITTILCTALASLAYLRDVLTWDGSLAAFAVGFVIGIFGDVLWLFLLLLFLVTSFIATRYKFSEKRSIGAQEGIRGERRYSNVLANGLAPTAVAIFSFLADPAFPKPLSGLVFVSAISVAASDTLASEIGVLSPRTYLITTLERVKPGTNGGVSLFGQGAALLAAIYTTFMAWIFLYLMPTVAGQTPSFPSSFALLSIPVVVGFAGCQLDSLIGATLEMRGLVSKKTVNLIATSLGGLMAYGLASLM